MFHASNTICSPAVDREAAHRVAEAAEAAEAVEAAEAAEVAEVVEYLWNSLKHWQKQ